MSANALGEFGHPGDFGGGRVRRLHRTVVHDRQSSDRDLVLAFQSGDPWVFEEIFRRYHGAAEGTCRRYLGSRDDAEEAAQETMVRVLRGLPAFRGDYALRAWVDRIATNVSLDVIRARARRVGSDPGTASGPGIATPDERAASRGAATSPGEPSEVVEAMAQSREVQATLARLPQHHRAALLLREVEGRSHVEIGDALGMSNTQAKALLHRARNRFRQSWVEDGVRRARVFVPLLLPGRLRDLLRQLMRADGLPATTHGEQLTAAVAALVIAGGITGAVLLPSPLGGSLLPVRPAPAATAVAPTPPAPSGTTWAPRLSVRLTDDPAGAGTPAAAVATAAGPADPPPTAGGTSSPAGAGLLPGRLVLPPVSLPAPALPLGPAPPRLPDLGWLDLSPPGTPAPPSGPPPAVVEQVAAAGLEAAATVDTVTPDVVPPDVVPVAPLPALGAVVPPTVPVLEVST